MNEMGYVVSRMVDMSEMVDGFLSEITNSSLNHNQSSVMNEKMAT